LGTTILASLTIRIDEEGKEVLGQITIGEGNRYVPS